MSLFASARSCSRKSGCATAIRLVHSLAHAARLHGGDAVFGDDVVDVVARQRHDEPGVSTDLVLEMRVPSFL